MLRFPRKCPLWDKNHTTSALLTSWFSSQLTLVIRLTMLSMELAPSPFASRLSRMTLCLRCSFSWVIKLILSCASSKRFYILDNPSAWKSYEIISSILNFRIMRQLLLSNYFFTMNSPSILSLWSSLSERPLFLASITPIRSLILFSSVLRCDCSFSHFDSKDTFCLWSKEIKFFCSDSWSDLTRSTSLLCSLRKFSIS